MKTTYIPISACTATVACITPCSPDDTPTAIPYKSTVVNRSFAVNDIPEPLEVARYFTPEVGISWRRKNKNNAPLHEFDNPCAEAQ